MWFVLRACACSFKSQEMINVYCMVRVTGVIEGSACEAAYRARCVMLLQYSR